MMWSALEMITRHFRQPRRGQIAAFSEWASESAVIFDPSDLGSTDIEALAPMDELLRGKRIVYLGEEDHWVREKNEYRLLLLRYLISRGWRIIGEELSWADGLRVNRYLQTGDESHLQRVATYGYRGGVRTERDDRPTGILKDTWQNYPVEGFAVSQIRLAQGLRAVNSHLAATDCPLRFFGIDLDGTFGGGYEELNDMLSTSPQTLLVAELRKRLALCSGETLSEEIERIDRLRLLIAAQRAELFDTLGETRFEELEHWTSLLRDGLEFARVANPATDWAILNQAMAQREQSMQRHVMQLLDSLHPDEKVVLMGHNRHLAKNDAAIRGQGGAPPGGRQVPSLGTYLHRRFPDQVYSIWMLWERGRSAQPYTWLSSEYKSVPGSLNAILATVGDAFLLPVVSSDPRARLLTTEQEITGIYGVPFRTVIAEQADAVFFFRQVTPM